MSNDKSTVIQGEFPFTELRTPTGDYYDNQSQLGLAGFKETQMWSVVETTASNGDELYVYGPVHHYINIVGYIGTAEHHDGNTYYAETVRTAAEAACQDAYFCDTCED